MADHTPTPWYVSSRRMRPTSTPYGVLISSARGDGFEYSVSWCAPHPGIDRATAEANAAFIVKAVNSHDALVKALTLAEDVLSRPPLSTEIWPNGMHPQTGIEQIRNALASIKEAV